MKANRKFVNADDGVSPVIGVILMVAITVVLAAVVFVLVSNLGGDTENTPTMSFDKSESADTLTVISASEASWADITVTITATGTNGVCEAGLNAAGDLVTGDAVGSDSVSAGDFIDIDGTAAGTTGTADAETCTISLTYTPSNSLLGSWTFTV